VTDVLRGERARPAGELQEDAVGILEVDRADKDPGVEVVADAPLTVVVISHVGAVHAGRPQAIAVLVDPFGGTAKATWFIEPLALVILPWSGRPVGPAMPGAGGGASGNQKNAKASPPPQSKKKC